MTSQVRTGRAKAIREAVADAVRLWLIHERREIGDSFATEDELDRMVAEPLEYSDMLKGVSALELLEAVLAESERPERAPSNIARRELLTLVRRSNALDPIAVSIRTVEREFGGLAQFRELLTNAGMGVGPGATNEEVFCWNRRLTQ